MSNSHHQQEQSSNGQLRIEVIDQLDELSRYADAWNTLALTTAPQLPSNSAAWLMTYFEFSVPAHESWCCLFAYAGDQLVGIMPLHITSRKIAGLSFTVPSLPKDAHTIAVAPLLANGHEATALAGLFDALWARYPAAIWFDMPDVPATSQLFDHIQSYQWHQQSQRTGAYLPVAGDQEEYQTSLSKNFRSNQRKAENKLKKEPAISYHFITKPDATSSQLQEFLPVEASGWKGREGTAIQQSENLIAFYNKLTERLADAGWLEWQFLHTEDKAIAANLAIRFGHGIVLWKLGYEESYSRCSPGGMLFQRLLDRTFPDTAITEINLLTEAPWYNNWRMDRRNYYALRFYQPGKLSSLLFGYLPGSLINLARKSKGLRSLVHKLRKLRGR